MTPTFSRHHAIVFCNSMAGRRADRGPRNRIDATSLSSSVTR